MIVSIDKAKKHLNLDDFYVEDDDYIVHLICSAESAVAKRLNVKDLTRLINPTTGYIPEDVTHAVLLLVGSWYNTRETFTNRSANKLPHSFDFLADLNKNYSSIF